MPDHTTYGLLNPSGLISAFGDLAAGRVIAAMAFPATGPSTLVYRNVDGIWRELGGNPLVVTYKTATEFEADHG